MSKIKPLVTIFLFSLLFSCSDTVVVENFPNTTPEAPAISGYFKKNVLIEDYTGTWCGNCTRVSHAIDLAKAQSDKVISVAIHNGNDPYHFQDIEPLKNLVSPNSSLQLPISRLNRTIPWTFPEVSNIAQVKNQTSNNGGLGIAINSSIANNNLQVDVKVKFAQAYSNNLRLVVYVLENHLIYHQFNYTSYYNNVYYIPNFEHNHVLRSCLTNLLGNPITETTAIGSLFTKSYSAAVPANIANRNNISLVAFIVDENNLVVNAREAELNENQTFQENP